MKRLFIICVGVLLLASCKEKKYCWDCTMTFNGGATTEDEYCNQTEKNIRSISDDFESSGSIKSFDCKKK